jgi:hypothetical protein
MNKTEEIQSLSINELVSGTQSRVHTKDQIHFRTDEYFHELVRRCIKERGLKTEAEFFEKLAKDYFGRIGWMKREKRIPEYMTSADLEMTDEEANIKMRKIDWYRKTGT